MIKGENVFKIATAMTFLVLISSIALASNTDISSLPTTTTSLTDHPSVIGENKQKLLASSKILQDLEKRKALNIAVAENSLPFSYFSADAKPLGYGYDIALLIRNEIEEKLNTTLQAKIISVETSERIQRIKNHVAYLECGTTSITENRLKQVSFSPPFYAGGVRMAVRNETKIGSLAQLKNKHVAVKKGTHALRIVQQLNKKNHLGLKFHQFDTSDQALQSVLLKRTDAFFLDDVLLFSAIARRQAHHQAQRQIEQDRKKDDKTNTVKNNRSTDSNKVANDQSQNSDLKVVGPLLSVEQYACMTPKNDPVFAELVAASLLKIKKNGGLQRLYDKWFMQPIPPTGLNLQIAANPATQALITAAPVQISKKNKTSRKNKTSHQTH